VERASVPAMKDEHLPAGRSSLIFFFKPKTEN